PGQRRDCAISGCRAGKAFHCLTVSGTDRPGAAPLAGAAATNPTQHRSTGRCRMNSTFPVAWILILLLILIVVGALAAIIWRSWIAGSVVLLVVLLIAGLYSVRAVPSSPTGMGMNQESATPASQQPELSDFLKTANIYSSTTEAAKFLALRVCDDIHGSQAPILTNDIHIVSAKNDRT